MYRDIVYEGSSPPSLWTLDPQAPVIRLGSFSKCLAPGLRVGWINARVDLLERLSAAGMLQSGGCVSQYAATVVARVMVEKGYQDHLAGLRRSYASRRDALADALREHLPADCRFTSPAGGFFIWLTLPQGLSATGCCLSPSGTPSRSRRESASRAPMASPLCASHSASMARRLCRRGGAAWESPFGICTEGPGA